ncbi:MAG: class I SAM-dependent methyltransferase [Bacteroidota bacterium]
MNSLMYTSEYATMFSTENELWWYVGLRSVLKHYLGKYAPAGGVVLDAGCGTGKNMAFISSLGFKVEGFDYSDHAIAFCQKRGLNQVQKGDITNIQWPNASFDVVTCMDVVGSLTAEDNLKAVSEMYRVLKPGGLLIAHTAALELFRSQHDDVANIKLRFNREQFKELFIKDNATILKLSYRVFLLSPLILLFKLIKRLTGKARADGASTSDQVLFPFGINWLLLQVQLFENWLFRTVNFPFGSSVFVVLKKA